MFALTIIEHFERSFFLSWQTNNFGDGFFSLGQSTEACWIREGVDLLDQFEGDKVEDEGLLVQHHDHHFLSQLHVHDKLICVKGNLCSILFLMIVPNNHFVSLLLIH